MVRVSGPRCLQLCGDIFGVDSPTPRRACLRDYNDTNGVRLDQCVFIYYQPGNSYTGDAMLELSLHGNPLIAQKVLDDLVARGCRLAEPGEFTRSAFLNGKMDLTQAEAVQDLIRARSDAALEAARKQLTGDVGQHIQRLRDELIQITAHLEAYIDFPEEDLPPEDSVGPLQALSQLIEQFAKLIATQHYSSLLQEGIRVVIIGRPNAGKSSLLNALLGHNRALVDTNPGTTRDYIEDRLYLGRHLFRLTDTAGLHESSETIERAAMQRTRDQLLRADIVLLLLDGTLPSPSFPPDLDEALRQHPLLVLHNKADLPGFTVQPTAYPHAPRLPVSARTQDGLSEVKDALLDIVREQLQPQSLKGILVNARHAQALTEARMSLDTARELLRRGEYAELAATHLHDAIAQVGSITGKIDNERILDELFAEFCIGK